MTRIEKIYKVAEMLDQIQNDIEGHDSYDDLYDVRCLLQDVIEDTPLDVSETLSDILMEEIGGQELWDYIYKGENLKTYLVKETPDNFKELIDEFCNEIDDDSIKEESLRHINTSLLNVHLNHNLSESKSDYVLSVIEEIRNKF